MTRRDEEKKNLFFSKRVIMTDHRNRRTIVFVASLCLLLVLICWTPFASSQWSVEAYAAALDSHRFAWWSNTAAAVQDDMGPCAMMLAANADDLSGLPAMCRKRAAALSDPAPAVNIPDVT
ncbi:hypothetical protein EBZ80_22785 [bacterium]|nr:hypothetical protein [bacterium]